MDIELSIRKPILEVTSVITAATGEAVLAFENHSGVPGDRLKIDSKEDMSEFCRLVGVRGLL